MKDNQTTQIDPIGQFVGCGAHKLNNAIQGAINGMLIFSQTNSSCLKFGGPKLADTRCCGRLRNMELILTGSELMATERNANPQPFSELDIFVVRFMQKNHEKRMLL